jgi:hypothetical protein
MRKHLIWVLGLVVALASVGIASIASAAPNTQSITAKIKPKKRPSSTRVPISLDVNVFATNPTNPQQIPFATKLALVDFDKDVKFQQKGYPTCDPTQFGSQSTTQDVKAACPDSIVGSGTATVLLKSGPGLPPLTVHAQTIGANVKGNKVLLHSYTQEAGGVPLVGSFVKSTGGSKYGTMLSTPVPPLAGGQGVISQFELKTDKIAYTNQGKHLAIVSAKCSSKKLDFQARFTDDQTPANTAVGHTTAKCKPKGH